MTADDYRHCMEVAVALLRQGQDSAAVDVLSDALAGRCHPAPTESREPVVLELAIEDDTPEIPDVFSGDAATGGKSVSINDRGWYIPPDVVAACSLAAQQAEVQGRSVYGIEAAVRQALRHGVKAGKVHKQ